MKQLQDTKKITLATLKSFINRNSGNLFVKDLSRFDGMTDCVESVNENWKPVSMGEEIGTKGVWCVGSSRDWFSLFQADGYIGIKVYNCCGQSILAVKVQP